MGLTVKKLFRSAYLLLLFSFVLTAVIVLKSSNADAVTNNTLNFQGRLLSNTGALVSDGSYNMQFDLYSVSSGGTTLWTEDRLVTNTQGVTVRDGYFSVRLGEFDAFPTNIDWDQELWLGLTVRGTTSCAWGSCTPFDSEMSPRFKLTAVPYAFRAGAVVDAAGNAYTGDDLLQKAPSTIQAVNAAVAAMRVNQTGSGGLLQFQGDGVDRFTVDKNGNVVASGGVTLGNSTSTTAGTLRWNGTSFEGYNGTAWAPLGSSAVTPFASKTKTANEIQNNVVNPTAALQPDDQLFFPIGANETWNYRFVLQIAGNATPDIKFSVTAPTGATCVAGVSEAENALAVGNLGCGVSSGIVPMTTSTDIYEVVGSVTNGSTAGNLTLNWAQNTANAANVTVLAGSFVEASRSVGGSNADVAFIQNGNTFGGLAVLGTNDANALSFETNDTERIRLLSTGEIRASDDLIANRTTTGITGTTSGTGTNTTTLTLAADTFNVNDVVLIDNVGQDFYTRVTVDAGTGSYTVSPAVTFENARTVTGYNIQNVGASNTNYSDPTNRFFQGYFLGGVVVGAGSTTISDGIIERTTGDIVINPGSGGIVQIGGTLDATTINATTITGDGSGLTNIDGSAVDGATLTAINASNISSGTLSDGRLSANVTLLGNTFNGANQLVRLDASGNIPSLNGSAITNLSAGNLSGALAALDGSALTSLNASNIGSGTLADARLSANVTLLGNTFNGVSQLVQLDGSGNLPALNGSAITNLSAGNIATGTLSDTRLSSNVVLLSGAQTLTGVKTFDAGLVVTSGQTVTIGGEAINDLSGTGLQLSGSSLSVVYGSGAGTAVQGNTSLTITAGTGLTGGATITLGSGGSSSLAVAYGSSAGTSVEGDTTITCSAGAGNLSGGGDVITLGAGGSCSNINISNSPTFSTSVTTPLLTSSGALSITSAAGADISIDSASNVVVLGDPTLRRSGDLTLELNGAATRTFTITNTNGANVANLDVEGDINAAGFNGDGSGLTVLNATNLSSGTVDDARLSGNVVVTGGVQTITGAKTFSAGITVSAGQSLTIGGEAVSDVTGTGLVISGGVLQLDTTYLNANYLRFAAGAVQSDASNNDVIALNKTSATGNLINIQRSGVGAFVVANSGALQIQSTSTTAIDIRNAGGTSFFTVDTSGNIVRIGSSTADATGVILVLDTKNTAGDPTGVAGAQYYNSAQEQFRCFREGVWEACGSNPINRTWVIEDEFMSGYTGGACTTTTAIVGDVNWACYTSGTATTAYNVGAILPSADRPGIMRLTTAAANGNGFTIAATGNNSGSVVLAANQRVQATVGQGATITNNRLRVGLHAQTTTNVRPTTGVWWEADATTNANWNYCFGTGAAATCASSGVAITASTLYSLDIRITATGAGTSAATFTINGTSFNVSGVTIGTATRVNPAISCFNSTAAARECYVDYFRASGTASARR